MGDFNLHVNDPADEDTRNFSYMMSALDLDQHISFLCAKEGTLLILLLLKLGSDLDICNIRPWTILVSSL